MPTSERVKQVIVVRTDLKMPVGKIAAQVSHASMAFLTRGLRADALRPDQIRSIHVDEEMAQWIDGAFTKAVVGCDGEEMLLSIYQAAKTAGCRASLIQDEGRTVFNGIPTYTCVGIGPNYESKVNSVSGALRLLK